MTPGSPEPDARTVLAHQIVASHEARLAEMGADVAFLRSELEARTEEIRRRDHIIAGFIERLPELPAGDHPHDMPQERASAPVRDDEPVEASDALIDRVRRLIGR